MRRYLPVTTESPGELLFSMLKIAISSHQGKSLWAKEMITALVSNIDRIESTTLNEMLVLKTSMEPGASVETANPD